MDTIDSNASETTRTGRMFFVRDGGSRQQEGIVVGANDALIVVEFDDPDVLPALGDEVHFAVNGRLLNTVVQRVDGTLVSIVRPHGVELRDVPATLPARAGFATTWRSARGASLSAWVLEMSVRGARLLAVRDEGLRTGEKVTIDLDGRMVRCTIDGVTAHRHPEHAIYELSFSLADASSAPPVARLINALRSVSTGSMVRPVHAYA
jgi:hypothetical protein